MSRFSHLKKLSIKDKTAEYPINQISLERLDNGEIKYITPFLIVSPATDVNKPYINASLRKMGKGLRRAIDSGKLDKDKQDKIRDIDKALYPEHVIKGWRDMPNEDGGDEPFTKEACIDFLENLPDEMFTSLRLFCMDNSNFSEVLDMESAEEIAKN